MLGLPAFTVERNQRRGPRFSARRHAQSARRLNLNHRFIPPQNTIYVLNAGVQLRLWCIVMRNLSVQVHIDFPALDNLVSYLKDQGSQQKQVDDLTAQVRALASRLHNSELDLSGAVAQAVEPS